MNIKTLPRYHAYLFFWNVAQPYGWMIGCALFFLVTSAITILSLGYGLRYLADHGFALHDLQFLNQSLYFLLAVSLILAITAFFRTYITAHLGEKISADLRQKLFDHLLTFDAYLIDQQKIGDLLSRLHADTQHVFSFINNICPVAIRSFIQLAGGTTLMLITSLKLTGCVFMIVPVIVIPIRVLGKRVRQYSQEVQTYQGHLQSFSEETLGALSDVQLFQNEEDTSRNFKNLLIKNWKIIFKRNLLRSILIGVVISFVFSAISGVIWLGGREVFTGQMTIGTLCSFIFYAVVVAGSLNQIAELLGDAQIVFGALDRITELFQLNPQVVQHLLKSSPLNFHKVEMREVTFSYPSRLHQPSLKKVSFDLCRGQRIALVGPSGAGKTTVFQLLTRLYDPQQGQILVNGMSMIDLSLKDVRQLFSCVPQNPAIFNATIFENITFGDAHADREAVLRAGQQAFVDEFALHLPAGYDTLVGERGIRLSGGQKQRVAIARALLRPSPILLLDEATNALDATSEHYIQQALDHITAHRTSLIIAHRLSTILKADRILVFDKGEIVQQGTHQELMKQAGIYRNLAEKQYFGDTVC